MKWVVLFGALVVAGYFGFRYRAGEQAKEALVTSLCAEEITAGVMANFDASQKAMPAGASLQTAGGLALQRKALYEGSSLGPHLPAFKSLGDPSRAEIKELALVVSVRCPDVFPEPLKAEKPIGYVWMMALDMPGH